MDNKKKGWEWLPQENRWMKTTIFFILCSLYFSPAGAQSFPAGAQEWTMQQCMEYAVAHNHEVRQSELQLDNYEARKTGAVGQFLPSVSADIGARYNFGRAIDPETNGYTNVSTFYNGYSLQASLPLFDGFSRLHALRAAQASVLMGRQVLRQRQDQTALRVLQAYVNAVYYEGMVRMAEAKREETKLLLRQTRVLEEVGRKSAADVALAESGQAESEYELSRQQGFLATALLDLKKEMNYPLQDTLLLADFGRSKGGVSLRETTSFITGNYQFHYGKPEGGSAQSADLLQSYQSMQASKHEWRQARAALYPSLSLSAGLSTTFYKTLHSDVASSFSSQLRNNMGEYIGMTLSIPLFNRLQSLTSIRRAKNNYLMAREAYEQKQLELEKLGREAWQDWQAYQLQVLQMEKKVEADSIAYTLTRRQYEEGLSTAIDLHTTSAQWLQAKAQLLQCQLMAIVKQALTRYYQGEQIWTE